MLRIIILILCSISILMCINMAFKDLFDKLTMYKDLEFQTLPNFIIWTFIFFGIFMFPFYKLIREKRKRLYYRHIIRDYEYWDKFFGQYHDLHNTEEERNKYLNCKRYLKLKEIERKSKGFKLWQY